MLEGRRGFRPHIGKNMETVKLVNGAEEVKTLVAVHLMVLETILTERPLALFDLAMKARDDTYLIWAPNQKYLMGLNLINADGSMHDSTRNIVISAVKGEGLDMHLCNPVAKGE